MCRPCGVPTPDSLRIINAVRVLPAAIFAILASMPIALPFDTCVRTGPPEQLIQTPARGIAGTSREVTGSDPQLALSLLSSLTHRRKTPSMTRRPHSSATSLNMQSKTPPNATFPTSWRRSFVHHCRRHPA